MKREIKQKKSPKKEKPKAFHKVILKKESIFKANYH
jgi:hypothetical protein